VLHLENNYPNAKTLSLGYFFELWNKEFNESCIFNFCTNETHEMKMYVNGNEAFDYENYVMQPEDKILIKYAQKEQSEVKEFKVTAEQFEFTPNTITVNQGDTVRLIVTSTDVAHGIGLPDFGVSAELLPGETTTVEFVADKAGTFDFVCSVYCGVGHSAMKGTIVIIPK
jgi:cytochrome c oxidase subunit 2